MKTKTTHRYLVNALFTHGWSTCTIRSTLREAKDYVENHFLGRKKRIVKQTIKSEVVQ